MGGTSDARYLALRNAIESSPQLLANFNVAASAATPLVDIIITAGTADSMTYNPSKRTIDISSGHLGSLAGSPDTATNHIAHELQHFFNGTDTSAAALTAQTRANWNNLLASISSFNGNTGNAGQKQNLTSYVQDYISINLANETSANIAGWNALLSKRAAMNGGVSAAKRVDPGIARQEDRPSRLHIR